ncbi:M20/M25/M40 family metallo-hydrolase, partial [Pirellulales bacterium]|nr:M20/M25/M40 family metallo-hydrolase [Pirellulales bacterium]
MREEMKRSSRATELLRSLVCIDSTNPMGRVYARPEPVERQAIEFIESLFAPHAAHISLERQSCSEFHESLVISLGKNGTQPVALFESHIDTVPADDWADRALAPEVRDGVLVGRGACDDKGSLAAMILALLEILEEEQKPPNPIVLL